ncbi:MAG: YczE/YyaS/YitT family protein [Gemmatimonadaceae bacterium]
MLGLFGYGVAIVFMIQSRLGLGPWDAFHVGISRLTPLSIGVASIVTGLAILVGSRLLGARIGAGTLANMVLIGVFIDLLLPHVPQARGWMMGLAYYLPALAMIGLCTGMYIAARLGSGPRDGLMLAVADRTGWPVRRVRTLIELSALGAGWAMGGQVGVGTVLFAAAVGPAAQWGLRLFGVIGAPPAVVRGGVRPAA